MRKETISPRDVREAVRNDRVIRSPRFHMGKHGLSFTDVLVALERCTDLCKDQRTDAHGRARHPAGWLATAPLPHRRRARIEFDAMRDGDVILYIVTGYRI